MIAVFLFGLAVVATAIHLLCKREFKAFPRIILTYLIFFNVGVMGLIAAYGHTFMAGEIAEQIGWKPGSPFQYEVAMANLSYGVLGVLSLWLRRLFWAATVIGFSLFAFGCFVGHIIQFAQGDSAPYNIGLFVWFSDLTIPLLLLSLLGHQHSRWNREEAA